MLGYIVTLLDKISGYDVSMIYHHFYVNNVWMCIAGYHNGIHTAYTNASRCHCGDGGFFWNQFSEGVLTIRSISNTTTGIKSGGWRIKSCEKLGWKLALVHRRAFIMGASEFIPSIIWFHIKSLCKLRVKTRQSKSWIPGVQGEHHRHYVARWLDC